ncbi:MAG: hypothetical protein R2762_09520 [Bryobacteraceae bacterium]
MRLGRLAFVAAAILAAIAARPQNHSQHRITPVWPDRPIPSITLHFVPDQMDGYNLYIETQNFRFTPEAVNTEPVSNEGHAHLYVNQRKVARLYSQWSHLSRTLLDGRYNVVRVELNANDHTVWGAGGEPVQAEVLLDASVQDRDPIVREKISYRLTWNQGAATREAQGGWSLTNDLGYRFHITAGRLVTRNLELITCHTFSSSAPAVALFGLFHAVQAGHSSLVPSQSRIVNPVEEDLATAGDQVLEPRTVTDPSYCEAHYLVAQPATGGPSFALSGTYRNPGEVRDRPFRVATHAAFGQIKTLMQADYRSKPAKPSPRRGHPRERGAIAREPAARHRSYG